MKVWVVDASVIIKWFMTENESDTATALKLLIALRNDNIKILQPFHWLAEVAAVITRLRPEYAENIINLLYMMELPVCNDLTMLNIACKLSKKYNHHLFDTLYHAVALYQQDTMLVTADTTYFNKIYQEGNIILLSSLKL